MATTDVEMTSPVGPLITPGCDQSRESGIPAYQPEIDLCQLLQALTLTKGKLKGPEIATEGYVPYASQSASGHDVSTEGLVYRSDASESSSSKFSSSDQPLHTAPPTSSTTIYTSRVPGCHFLQSILASLAPESPALFPSPSPYPAANAFQTTNGAYLDTLLLHRSLLSAFPAAHTGCAATLHEIARAVELRAWQADRDADAEAIAALRQEAHIVARWM